VAVAVTLGAAVGGLVVSGHAASTSGPATATATPTANANASASGPAPATATPTATANASAVSGTTRPGAAYLAIALAGNKRLDADFDRLHGRDRRDPARADADLRDIAATERSFDQRLAALRLPPGPAEWARVLVTVNEQRAALTTAAASSATPVQLAGYEQRLTAANIPAEWAVRAIRAELGLPAPDTD
jgi:hypothetical protein